MPFQNVAKLRNPKTEVKPKVVSFQNECTEIYFDVTLIVDQDNNMKIIDNTKSSYHDFLDCNTLAFKKVKVQVC